MTLKSLFNNSQRCLKALFLEENEFRIILGLQNLLNENNKEN